MAEASAGRFLIEWTIARRIMAAFAAMMLVSMGLMALTVLSVSRATGLAGSMQGEVLPANFARAIGSDFSRMQAAVAMSRRVEVPDVVKLHKSFRSDLANAVASLPDPDVQALVTSIREAEENWIRGAQKAQATGGLTSDALAKLDDVAQHLQENVGRLVERVDATALERRTSAKLLMARDISIAVAGAALAAIVALLAGFGLQRGIKAPLGRAVAFANDLAQGRLDSETPRMGSDELSRLIGVMASMRDRICGMLEEQILLRQTNQARIAEAIDGSHEGMIVADARGVIQVANAQALDFLGLTPKNLTPGVTLETLRKLVGLYGHTHRAMLKEVDGVPETEECVLPDGRRIQNSRHRTTEGGFVGLYTDVTALVSQKESLAASKATLDAALSTMSQALCVFDQDHRLRLANRQAHALFGIDPNAATIGTSYLALLDLSVANGNHPGVDPARLRRHERHMADWRRRKTRFVPFRADRILAVTHEPMEDGGWLGTYEDVTERRRSEAHIAHLATHDALTGLGNRVALEARVRELLEWPTDGGFMVLCLGIDHFKEVNDAWGHGVGDAVLRGLARRLTDLMRRSDLVVRLGGDEFAVVRTTTMDMEEASAFADQVLRIIDAPFVVDDVKLAIGATAGVVVAPRHGSTYAELLRNADLAMNDAKEKAPGTCQLFEPALQEQLNDRITLENDLRRALAGSEFELYYQPLLDLASMEVRCFEALMRWNHPTRGMVMPGDFIPAAERMGLINALGRWALIEACREAAQWPSTIKIAVNLSLAQLRDNSFAAIAEGAMQSSGLAPDRLELELTETMFMSNAAQAKESLLSLKHLGVRFAMDDFGTGYSSLSYLRRFAFDKIKIDRSFLQNLSESREAEQIIRTIVTLGRNLGLRVTAEGVETPRQLKFLNEIGCDEIQGYLIGKPMPAAQVPRVLVQYNGQQGDLLRSA